MKNLKNILLIEDDENISFGIKTYLDKRNFNVTVGNCIGKGTEFFKTSHDLIILDMNLQLISFHIFYSFMLYNFACDC